MKKSKHLRSASCNLNISMWKCCRMACLYIQHRLQAIMRWENTVVPQGLKKRWGEGLGPTGCGLGAHGTQTLVVVKSSKSFLKFSLPSESRTHYYWKGFPPGGAWPSCTGIIHNMHSNMMWMYSLCACVLFHSQKKWQRPMRWICCCLNTCSWILVQSNSTCLVYCKGIIV